MLTLNTIRIEKNIPFQMYLLSDRLVKKLNKEFEFYNVRFYREERVREPTVCVDYPYGNMYWYTDFKKFIKTEILEKDVRYESEWNNLLDRMKRAISSEFTAFQNAINSVTAKDVVEYMNLYSLRDYQAFDLLQLKAKMQFNEGNGLILSEQRTGKTRVALAAMLESAYPGDNVLIVCPPAAVSGWRDECIFYCDNKHLSLRTRVIRKIKDIKDLEHDWSDLHINVNILTYNLFKMLTVPQTRTVCGTSHSKNLIFIGDEVHRLRNFKTMQSDAIFSFKDLCKRDKVNLKIIGVTGTPAVKDSSDVFGSLCLINTSKISFQPYYKDFNQFKEYFYNCEDTSYGKVCKSLRRVDELNHLIQTVSVQTKQRELDMFKNYTKKYLKVNLNMDSEQRAAYTSVRDTMEYGDDIDCMNGLVQLLRLQQLCIDPSGLVSAYEGVAPKVQWVIEFAKKNDFQFIVFAKKTKVFETLINQLESNDIPYSLIRGGMSVYERDKETFNFKSGKSKVYLIQLDAGRESLTLPEAKCTVFLDRDYAQGFNEQAEARMTPVDGSECTKYVIDLIMNDTVEEGIYDILVMRKESIENINTVKSYLKKGGETNGV